MIDSHVEALFIGKPKPFRSDGATSSIGARLPVEGPVKLTCLGFDGDQVADPVVHGGPDKAVHFYPAEHYAVWRAHLQMKGLPTHPLLEVPGGFGENIAASGLTEDKVRIGDRFRIGTALVEIAQGRQPCWKIDHHFGIHGMTAAVITTGRCGLYFRVIEEGLVSSGDVLLQVERAAHDWTVARTFRLLIAGGHRDEGVMDGLIALAEMEVLADSWRIRAAQLSLSLGKK
jgi:MOSC domain-containing protein YiiM